MVDENRWDAVEAQKVRRLIYQRFAGDY